MLTAGLVGSGGMDGDLDESRTYAVHIKGGR